MAYARTSSARCSFTFAATRWEPRTVRCSPTGGARAQTCLDTFERVGRAGLKIRMHETTPAGLEVPEWEYESTARQLARLARLDHPTLSENEFEKTEAGKALASLLGNDARPVRSAFRGKFGLALSGG